MSKKIITHLTNDYVQSLKSLLSPYEHLELKLTSIDQKYDEFIYGSHIQLVGDMVKLGVVLYSDHDNCNKFAKDYVEAQLSDKAPADLDPYEIISEVLNIISGNFNNNASQLDSTMQIGLPIDLKNHHMVLSTSHYQVAHFNINSAELSLCLFSIF